MSEPQPGPSGVNDRKRTRTNFSPHEKQILLARVAKYKEIVENKCTKSDFVHKKNQIWTKITQEFNCSAETGSRSAKQLKILYDNIKRSARKTVAEEHHENYAAKLNAAKRAASNDKKELFKTGGGTYIPTLDSEQEQLLADLKLQVQPLSNPFDSAAVYFSDVEANIEVIEYAAPEQEHEEPAPVSESKVTVRNPPQRKKKRCRRCLARL